MTTIREVAFCEYSKHTLSSGVTLVSERHPYVRAVSIGAWVRTGSVNEKASQRGISHFIEHMLFKGTKTRTPLEIATALESLGGELNAFTDREYTCYHATILSEYLSVALEVLSDILVNPTFPAVELKRERNVLLQEMAMVEEAPDEWVNDLFFESVWQDEPLGLPIIGSRKSLRKIGRKELLTYFVENYTANNIVISVAGNFEPATLVKEAEKHFRLPPGLPRSLEKSVPRFHSKKKSVGKDLEQFHVVTGFEGLGFQHPLRYDSLILSFFLGGGMSSRLFQEIREKAALAYSVECDVVPFSKSGLFTIYVATQRRSARACLQIIGREISNLKKNALSEKDLNLVKGQVKGLVLLSSDSMESRQESLGRNELVFGRYIGVEEVIREIDSVTALRVQTLANQIFVEKKQATVALGRGKMSAEELSVFQ